MSSNGRIQLMTTAQRRQTRRGLPTGLLMAGIFGTTSLAYGSFAAGGVAAAGLLMAISSAVFLHLDRKSRQKAL